MQLDEARFRARFGRSALRRTKRRGLLRNVAVALGNSGNPAAIRPLRLALDDPEPLVRSHAAWALGQLQDKEARIALDEQFRRDEDEQVRREIMLALHG